MNKSSGMSEVLDSLSLLFIFVLVPILSPFSWSSSLLFFFPSVVCFSKHPGSFHKAGAGEQCHADTYAIGPPPLLPLAPPWMALLISFVRCLSWEFSLFATEANRSFLREVSNQENKSAPTFSPWLRCSRHARFQSSNIVF